MFDIWEKKNMKKSMVVVILGVLLLSGVWLMAAEEKKLRSRMTRIPMGQRRRLSGTNP